MSAAPISRHRARRRPTWRAGSRPGRLLALATLAAWLGGLGQRTFAAELAAAATSVPRVSVPEAVGAGAARRVWTTDPLAMFRLYAARGLLDPRLTLEALRPGSEVAVQPIAGKSMDPLARRLLASAFPLALQHLGGSPTCRALYEDLGTDGLLVLSTTIYFSPSSAETMSPCGTLRAIAYTRVGQQTTIICPAFARLSRARAAVTLLHEALHYAGLTEKPGDPAGLTSADISTLVRDRCGL